MLCVKCQKRPAVVFVQRLENGKTVQEGYCLTCARAMHIQPVDDLMKQFGMSDQDLENMEERMSSFLQEAADSGMMAPMMGGDMTDGGDENAPQDDFVPGGSPGGKAGVGGGAARVLSAAFHRLVLGSEKLFSAGRVFLSGLCAPA